MTLAQHLLVLGLVVLDVVVRAMRIRRLLPVTLGRAVVINTSGDALAAVTPARMGGEPLRFFAFRRAGASTGAVLAAFATEVGVDVVVLGGVGTLLGVWMARHAASPLAVRPDLRLVALVVFLGVGLVGLASSARFRARLETALRDAREALRTQSWSTLLAVAALTVVSVATRTAILPVLAARVPGVSWGPVIAGSFVLVFGQGILPIPGGLGAVDLGFAVGFSPLLNGASLARLLILWRFYSLGLGAIAGALLMAWTATVRLKDRLAASRAAVAPLLDARD